MIANINLSEGSELARALFWKHTLANGPELSCGNVQLDFRSSSRGW
jgi:hypothetical protein